MKKKLSLAFLFLVSITASFFIGNSLQKEKHAAADQVIDSISADLDVANEVISVLKTENISHL